MELDLGESRQLTKEETDELYKIRTATPEQLLSMAEKCGHKAELANGTVYITDGPAVSWNPRANLTQNHLLLATVIAEGDCRLLYDDGIKEYFIYKFRYAGASGRRPPLANHHTLQDTVFAAAMELWFPEDE